MTKWEYKIQGIRNFGFGGDDDDDEFFEWKEETERVINHFGNQGWELVSVDNSIAYFKRRLIEFPGLQEAIRTGYSADI